MIKLPIKVRFEQAVYGSFPFWHRGYAVLSQSAGCRPEWLTELRAVCQRCGEPPAGLIPADSFFALRLKNGPWMIVGAFPQGNDDQGRPGATAFHALFVGPWAYRWAGADPFAFAGAMRGQWSIGDLDQKLFPCSYSISQSKYSDDSNLDPAGDPRLVHVVTALKERRRVIVQSAEPIDGLARSVWRILPRKIRRRVTVATWVFDTSNPFDLIGLPKLAGVALHSSDLVLAHDYAGR